jgi:hypothetical protein
VLELMAGSDSSQISSNFPRNGTASGGECSATTARSWV